MSSLCSSAASSAAETAAAAPGGTLPDLVTVNVA